MPRPTTDRPRLTLMRLSYHLTAIIIVVYDIEYNRKTGLAAQ